MKRCALLLSLLLLSGKKRLIEKQLELDYGKRPEIGRAHV